MERKFKIGEKYRANHTNYRGTVIEITSCDGYGCKCSVIKGNGETPRYFAYGSPFADSLEPVSENDMRKEEMFVDICIELSKIADRLEELNSAFINLFKDDPCAAKEQPAYTAKVVCINSNNSIVFEKGVIYEIENGVIKGRETQFDEPIKDLADLNVRSVASFIEVVG